MLNGKGFHDFYCQKPDLDRKSDRHESFSEMNTRILTHSSVSYTGSVVPIVVSTYKYIYIYICNSVKIHVVVLYHAISFLKITEFVHVLYVSMILP